MPYTKQQWHDDTTTDPYGPINAARLGHIEDGVDYATTTAESAAGGAVPLGTAAPLVDGAAAAGTSGSAAHEDHVHPVDTSRAPLASPSLTGTPAAPTAAVDTNTTQIATTAYVVGQAYAKLASPTFTGTPAAPTASAATSTTQLATTAFVTTADNLKANLASPTFTGHPVGVTESALDNSTRLATTAYADTAVGVETTRASAAEALKAPLASPTFTGTATIPNIAGPTTLAGTVTLPSTTVAVTPSANDNSTKPATTAYVDTADALKANLASPTFTGTPAAPTAAAATSTTQIATTAMVQAAIAATSGAVGGFAKVLRRTGDATAITANATPASDDTLILPVGATDVWDIEAFILVLTAAGSGTIATEDMKIGWSGPTGVTAFWGGFAVSIGAIAGWTTGNTGSSPTALTGIGSTISIGMVGPGTLGVSLKGIFIMDGAHSGNIVPQFSQVVSDGSSLTIRANSWMRCTRLA